MVFVLAAQVDGNKLGENEGDASSKEIITKSTYDENQSILNSFLSDIMKEFSSHVTALHDPMFFSRRRFPTLDNTEGSRSFSSWDPFHIAGTPQSVTRWSPRYEIIDDENSFALKVDVPGFHFHEINVGLEAGGRVLRISGTKEEDASEEWNNVNKEEDDDTDSTDGDKESMKFSSHMTRSFQQKFTLDPTIDSTKMSANLDPVHGTLVIRAPRKQRGIEHAKHIPITQVRGQTKICCHLGFETSVPCQLTALCSNFSLTKRNGKNLFQMIDCFIE